MKLWVLSALTVAVLAGCNSSNNESAQAPAAPAAAVAPAEKVLVTGIDATQSDATVRAQDDLFRSVNGTWLKDFAIPADKSNYGSFSKLGDAAEANLRTIIDESAKQENAAGSEAQKVGDFYKSWMDEAKINELGIHPIDAMVAEIDAIKDKKELAAWYGKIQRIGVPSPMYLYIQPDEKNSTQYIAYFYQGGVGLPNRDYYFDKDAKFAKFRDEYKAHMGKMFELAGWKDPAGSAKRVCALEEKIAFGHNTSIENRDSQKTYNKMSVDALKKMAPDFDWSGFLNSLSVGSETEFVVNQPKHLQNFNKVLKSASLDDLKLHARWMLLTSQANGLAKAFDDENFRFYRTVLSGVPEQEARWKRGVQMIDGGMGEAVGKIYVEKHFSPEAKSRMEKLVQNLLKAYGEGIDSLEWMTPETKKAAHDKLSKIVYKIGYPNQWRDYSALETKPDDLVGNIARANEFEYQRNLNKLGKPIDRNEWGMTPQTVNAYYNPVMNEIVFPAAILQPPFFNMDADDAVNYGGIGAVIGHELGHAFDDQGSQYDGDGNMKNWWSDADKKEFDARTAKLVAQYDAFEPLPGQHVQGQLTLGENIGDLSGMTIAHRAYLLSLEGKASPVMENMTGDQRFFMGWAQVWSRKYRDEELLKRLKTDPHSPSEFRCNGTARNMPEFYTAFNVKEGDKLYLKPEDRVKIW